MPTRSVIAAIILCLTGSAWAVALPEEVLPAYRRL